MHAWWMGLRRSIIPFDLVLCETIESEYVSIDHLAGPEKVEYKIIHTFIVSKCELSIWPTS